MPEAPLTMRWDGEALHPVSQFWAARADKIFVVGEVYRIIEHHERSQASHNHFFAAIGNAWANLPDAMLTEYPTAEHLRKKLLVRAGYADERSIVCASKAEALRVAAFIKPLDDYAVVTVREAVVRVYTAQSQSVKAMGAAAFQASKQAVLDALDNLLGVDKGATAGSEAA
jgi:hypothetical protein